MSKPLRIAIADDEPDMRDYFARILPLLGHRVVVSATNGLELVVGCRSARPDLIITDVKMPDMDGIDAAQAVCRETPIPVILISAHHDLEVLRRAEPEHVMAHLVKPIKQIDLEPAIALAVSRFAQLEELRREASGS